MGNSTSTCCSTGPKKLFSRGEVSMKQSKSSHFLDRSGGLSLLPDNRNLSPSDKYDISKEILGTGAFGTVKKAKVRKGERIVALKTIKKQAIPDKKAFANEVEINAALDHPNIAKLFETFEDKQNVYLVLELCHGGEMFDKIIDQGNFTEIEAATLIFQILSAIYYMHMQSIAHRDLKPENFLLVEKLPKNISVAKNTLKVIDFGIARRFKRDRDGNTVPMMTRAGTAYYVAPEVMAGKYDEKCDVWSCGVILFILLCGSPPFSGDSDAQIMAQAKRGLQKKQLEDEFFDHVSQEAKDLIMKMCTLKAFLRISAEDALHSGWVQSPKHSVIASGKQPSSEEFIKRMKKFSAVNRFKKAAIQIIARRLDDGVIKELRNQFSRMDENGDGKLTFQELKQGCAAAGLTDIEGVQKIFDEMDTDNSGFIGYTEFLASMIDGKNYQTEENCWEAFRVFDKDGSGSISLEELQQIISENEELGAKASGDVAKLFADADTNGDGQISFEEFMALMRTE